MLVGERALQKQNSYRTPSQGSFGCWWLCCRHTYIHIYIYIYIQKASHCRRPEYVCMHVCIYIYICIWRVRERQRLASQIREHFCARAAHSNKDSVDVVVSDLPFGRKYGSVRSPRAGAGAGRAECSSSWVASGVCGKRSCRKQLAPTYFAIGFLFFRV